MDQAELNKVAMDAIKVHRREVAAMLRKAITHDATKRSKRLPRKVLRHVHSAALFDCVVGVNSLALIHANKNVSEEFYNLVDTLEPKFFEIVRALREF